MCHQRNSTQSSCLKEVFLLTDSSNHAADRFHECTFVLFTGMMLFFLLANSLNKTLGKVIWLSRSICNEVNCKCLLSFYVYKYYLLIWWLNIPHGRGFSSYTSVRTVTFRNSYSRVNYNLWVLPFVSFFNRFILEDRNSIWLQVYSHLVVIVNFSKVHCDLNETDCIFQIRCSIWMGILYTHFYRWPGVTALILVFT